MPVFSYTLVNQMADEKSDVMNRTTPLKLEMDRKRRQRSVPKKKHDLRYPFVQKLLVKIVLSGLIVVLFSVDHMIPLLKSPVSEMRSAMHSTFNFAEGYQKWGTLTGLVNEQTVMDSGRYAIPVTLSQDQVLEAGALVFIPAETNEQVIALRAGMVLFTGLIDGEGAVVIQHTDSKQTVYTPVITNSLKPFDYVKTGQVIGTSAGESGFHFKVSGSDSLIHDVEVQTTSDE
ncbi:M23 family metallopeptidase [Jeotgalibacillus sp. R-1-5s-1]|nr:M23 family metallopeptidase [Jeotgalibacillus sp. R-1-5s-1]